MRNHYKKRLEHDQSGSLDQDGTFLFNTTHNNKWIFASWGDYFFIDEMGAIYEYGTWEILDNDSKLHLSDNSLTNDCLYDIEVTDDKFVFSRPYTSNSIAKITMIR